MEEQAITNFYLKMTEEPPVPPKPVPVPDPGSGVIENMILTGDYFGLLVLILLVICLCVVLFFLVRVCVRAIRGKDNNNKSGVSEMAKHKKEEQ